MTEARGKKIKNQTKQKTTNPKPPLFFIMDIENHTDFNMFQMHRPLSILSSLSSKPSASISSPFHPL